MLSLYLFLVLGFIGSGHCVGMCGPFVISYIRTENNYWYSHVLYGLGRATTYAFMGFVVSIFGEVLQQLVGVRAAILILAGLIMVYLSLGQLHLLPTRLLPLQNRRWYQKSIGILLDSKTWYRTYPLGVLLGFIPCGLTAIALSLAITQPVAIATLGMFIFGLGTMPAMVGFGLTIQRLKIPRLERYMAILMAILGSLTVWMGLHRLGWAVAPPQKQLLMRLHPKSVPGKKSDMPLIHHHHHH
ncbi:MAG: sulfite exporter TauE/SafE family protein [Oscillatoriaceae bacterium SKW80]|nr:sulfite exporter TauE/SafE family protein [Oscillatoriaceae bacterium SKYG93]MCX8121877.1 sulfite exporter TauE/SafE family protein [Oscillatoriaceae bacterium SKW80]MDW8454638.1 sulfite exporter TauE/SafE family protein [Oscillatoriaceae cyanobacterium SKYGB_i_bin93]HIK27448.1 sulfite exporter TauE/SafE family protein [Oscillatoriaceae cyanobacterium M7585_C2015_266]